MMKASLSELRKAQDEYYRWWHQGTHDTKKRAEEYAVDNFNWVLDTALEYAESEGE